jgi:hypothetical protein
MGRVKPLEREYGKENSKEKRREDWRKNLRQEGNRYEYEDQAKKMSQQVGIFAFCV